METMIPATAEAPERAINIPDNISEGANSAQEIVNRYTKYLEQPAAKEDATPEVNTQTSAGKPVEPNSDVKPTEMTEEKETLKEVPESENHLQKRHNQENYRKRQERIRQGQAQQKQQVQQLERRNLELEVKLENVLRQFEHSNSALSNSGLTNDELSRFQLEQQLSDKQSELEAMQRIQAFELEQNKKAEMEAQSYAKQLRKQEAQRHLESQLAEVQEKYPVLDRTDLLTRLYNTPNRNLLEIAQELDQSLMQRYEAKVLEKHQNALTAPRIMEPGSNNAYSEPKEFKSIEDIVKYHTSRSL